MFVSALMESKKKSLLFKDIEKILKKKEPEPLGRAGRAEDHAGLLTGIDGSPLCKEFPTLFSGDSRGGEGVMGNIDLSQIKADSPEDLLFPDAVLSAIDTQRVKILKEISDFVDSKEWNDSGPVASAANISRALRLLCLEVEKLQALSGSRCVDECRSILDELESAKLMIMAQSRPARPRHSGLVHRYLANRLTGALTLTLLIVSIIWAYKYK